MEPTNEEHGERARRAIMAVCADELERGEDLGTAIYDLVADLLHLARISGIEPDHIIHMAKMHFDAEVWGEEIEGGTPQ